MESPFKEKITMQSETENSGRKSTFDDELESCPFKGKRAEKTQPVPEEPESDDEPKGGCPVMTFKRKLTSQQSQPRPLRARAMPLPALHLPLPVFPGPDLQFRTGPKVQSPH